MHSTWMIALLNRIFLISHCVKIGTNKAHFGSVTFVYVKFRWRGGGGEINTKISNVFKIVPKRYNSSVVVLIVLCFGVDFCAV